MSNTLPAADIAGYALVFLLWVSALAYGYKKGAGIGALTVVCVVVAHTAVAHLALLGYMPHADKDNLNFFNQAVAFTQSGEIPPPEPHSLWWPWAISLILGPLGDSLWMAYAANQWIFFFAVAAFVSFYCEVFGRRGRWRALLFFGLVPSALLYSNLLFRESLQILLLILIFLNLERYRRSGSLKPLAWAALAFIPFGAVHNGLFLFAPIAFFIALSARFLSAPATRQWHISATQRQAMALMLICVIAAGSLFAAFPEQRRIQQLASSGVDLHEVVEATEDGGARTTFPWRPQPGTLGTILFAPVQLFQFLFAPVVPNMVYERQDAVAALDSLARIVMLFGVALLWKNSSKEGRRTILLLLALYLSFCLITAMGTRTSGTAMRHHLKVFWVIIAMGSAGYASAIRILPRPTAYRPQSSNHSGSP